MMQLENPDCIVFRRRPTLLRRTVAGTAHSAPRDLERARILSLAEKRASERGLGRDQGGRETATARPGRAGPGRAGRRGTIKRL